MMGLSEVMGSRKAEDFDFENAVHVPSGSESTSLVSAQSEPEDRQATANPIATAIRAAADALTEVTGPATKVMALASANVVDGASTSGLQMSFYTTASLERMLALILSIAVLLGLWDSRK